ncbi:MAG TPA: hypothetical protein VKU88_13080, partial [Acidimicrobiales bacterium]|nr:hypothetical protein [Acidimicrobiales bacterium]
MSGAPPLAAPGDSPDFRPMEGLEPAPPVAGGRPLPAGLGPAREEDPAWCVAIGEEEGDVDDPKGRAAGSLLCVADGTIGTLGVLEDHGDAAAGVLVAGLYRPAPDVTETLMALPGWCSLPLVEGLPSGRRVLDLRDGVLTRV